MQEQILVIEYLQQRYYGQTETFRQANKYDFQIATTCKLIITV